MRQSYEAAEERHGKQLANTLAIWNKIYRESGSKQERKAVKILINAVYRGGVCEEWVNSPNEAVKEVISLLGDNCKKVVRLDTNAPLSPENMQVII